MELAVLAPVFVFAGLDWVAVARGNRRAEYFFKPATTGALVMVAYLIGGDAPELQHDYIVAALAFSLIGDIFLMLPADLFIYGLAAFLVAHICYIVAFQPVPTTDAASVVLFVAVGLLSAVLFARLYRGLAARGRRRLVLPVWAYVIVITLMVDSALVGQAHGGLPLAARVSAGLGALLFYLSDALIGWHRFVRPLSWAPVAIMVTYHLGQTGLVLSLAR